MTENIVNNDNNNNNDNNSNETIDNNKNKNSTIKKQLDAVDWFLVAIVLVAIVMKLSQ